MEFRHQFSFTQEDVIAFARLSGDNNPLHLDPVFAATTQFKRPIIHGMLGMSVFTKVLGTEFPGAGSVYLKQTVEFLRPMVVDNVYEAVFKVITTDDYKHTAEISTEVFDIETQKPTIRGVATVMNKEHF